MINVTPTISLPPLEDVTQESTEDLLERRAFWWQYHVYYGGRKSELAALLFHLTGLVIDEIDAELKRRAGEDG